VNLKHLILIAAISTAGLGTTSAAPLRVMVWNIHHGRGADGKVDLVRIADVIRRQSPDVVMLQEVDRNMPRSGKTDQSSELARLLEMNSVFGKAVNFAEGEYGLAVLSRGRIVSGKVHPLPGEAGEPRIGFTVTLDYDGKKFAVVNTHLDHISAERRLRQAEAVAALGQECEMAILGGDFNDGPGSATLDAITPTWTMIEKVEPKATAPADRPAVEIDHLFVRGLRVVENARVIDESRASDHRPIVAVFDTPATREPELTTPAKP
jgi:endonuclease/exonuclease/phosphatase family metal-dependent hydrolase